MVKCAVRGCQNQSDLRPGEMISRPRKRFFSFPADKGRLRVWLAALRESECFKSDLRQICEDHFLPEHITSTGISPEAIPIMPPLEGALLAAEDWTSPLEPGGEMGEISEPPQVVTEIPADDDDEGEEEEVCEDEEDYDDEDGEDEDEEEEEEEYEDSDLTEEDPSNMDEHAESEWLSRLQENLKTSAGKKCITQGSTSRSDLTLGRLTKRFMELFSSAPGGILDLNEATQKLGTRKRRVYDITSVLNGIKLITKKTKNKVQWVGPTPINSFKAHRKNKLKVDLFNLTTMEEALDWLIKDCAQQLFALTDLKENANSAYVTYEDICRIAIFQDQTLIAVKAPEETKLEVPTPTEECIKIHLKASRGPIHVLTCETDGPGSTTESKKPKMGCFRTLEESRIETKNLPTSVKRIPAQT